MAKVKRTISTEGSEPKDFPATSSPGYKLSPDKPPFSESDVPEEMPVPPAPPPPLVCTPDLQHSSNFSPTLTSTPYRGSLASSQASSRNFCEHYSSKIPSPFSTPRQYGSIGSTWVLGPDCLGGALGPSPVRHSSTLHVCSLAKSVKDVPIFYILIVKSYQDS